MRRDVSALLEKLGRREFRYEAFSDPISDLEPWPLFAALLHDPRVVGTPQRADERTVQTPAAPMFARYGGTVPDTPPEHTTTGDLRSFLSGLSDDNRGKR